MRSKERVRDLGEVFTPDFLVEQMLDQFPMDAWGKHKNWLEPTCGNGQFILGILRRKLLYGHTLLEALDTTFGADIMPDNISECHIRIYREIVLPYVKAKKLNKTRWSNLRWKAVCLVENNIRLTKDSLQEDFNRWQYFKNLTKDQQTGLKTKVISVLELIDNNQAQDNVDERLYQELSILQRKSK